MRAQTVIVALALVLAVAAIPAVGMAATDSAVMADQHANETDGTANETDGTDSTTDADDETDDTETDPDNETDGTDNETDANASIAPGQRLSGVVGIQEAELDGEVEGRAFGIKIAQAASNESRADVVAEQLGEIEERLNETEQRKEALEAARENGSISEGKYRAEMAKLAAQTETTKELTNRSENASEGLPAELLESKGVNASAIQTLKDRAGEMSGPEVAAIARSIAGKSAPGAAGPPEDRGPGEDGPSQKGGPGEDGPAQKGGPGDDGGDGGPPEDQRGGDDDSESDDNSEETDTATPNDGGGTDEGSDSTDEDSASDGGSGSSNGGGGY